jgi:hypothetical protein
MISLPAKRQSVLLIAPDTLPAPKVAFESLESLPGNRSAWLGASLHTCGMSDGIEDRFRVFGNDLEQDARTPLGTAATLLPIAERSDANAHERSEVRLGEAVTLPNRTDIGRQVVVGSGGSLLARENTGAFLNTGQELVEDLFLHWYSASTILRSWVR